MLDHERPSRPVLFSDQESDYPYWGKGSSVIVSSKSYAYLVTARHVMERQYASPRDLFVTPVDESSLSLPFNELTKIATTGEMKDFEDLYLLRIDLDDFKESSDSDLLYAWNIEEHFHDCSELSRGDVLYVLGFPSDGRLVDFEEKRIHFKKVVLRGLYEGLSVDDHCHKLRLETSVEYKDLDGYSGGTVFLYPPSDTEPARFVGIVIRGTAGSSIMHFIDCAVLRDLITRTEAA